jgi:hypothetical protein
MYVGGLEVEEVEEGGVVHGERGPSPRGTGGPPPPKSAGLPGITRQRVGLPLKIFD